MTPEAFAEEMNAIIREADAKAGLAMRAFSLGRGEEYLKREQESVDRDLETMYGPKPAGGDAGTGSGAVSGVVGGGPGGGLGIAPGNAQ